MASPPYNSHLAMPPPFSPSEFSQPRKRRQSEISSSSSTLPRTPSLLSEARSHPKQTAYTGNLDRLIKGGRSSRSPSVDGMSQVTGMSNASGGKRKRTQKSRAKGDDESSVVGGGARSVVSRTSGKGKRRQTKEVAPEEEEDDEDVAGPNMALDLVGQTEEEREKDKAKKALFVLALDAEQEERYVAYLSSKLIDAPVRKLINATLSQSVPAAVILAIRSIAKVYIGDIIQGARRVQAEWDATDDEIKALPGADHPAVQSLRAPLLPEHLREARRRLQMSAEDGLVGQLGLWNNQASTGVERFAIRAGGKRLFK